MNSPDLATVLREACDKYLCVFDTKGDGFEGIAAAVHAACIEPLEKRIAELEAQTAFSAKSVRVVNTDGVCEVAWGGNATVHIGRAGQ